MRHFFKYGVLFCALGAAGGCKSDGSTKLPFSIGNGSNNAPRMYTDKNSYDRYVEKDQRSIVAGDSAAVDRRPR